MKMVEVSVIIPAYNVEEYIGDCLDSIINQTFEDFEIICVNDGSQDNTLKVLREYENKEPRIKVFDQENKGVGSARNVGMDASKGQYLFFVDADDLIDKNALTELYNIAKQNDADLIISKRQDFNNDSNIEFEEKYNEMEQIPSSFKNKLFSFKDLLEYFTNLDVTVTNKFFKQEFIGNVRFDEDVIFEDNLFTIDYFFRANKIFFYDKVLYYRRLRSNSIITSSSQRHVDSLEVNNRMVQKIKNAGYYDDIKEKLFVKNLTKISYRFIDIDDEYKEYFFKCLKEDFTNNWDRIESELDFSLIDDRIEYIFRNLVNCSHFWELELRIRCYDYELEIAELKSNNEKLLAENEKLKCELERISK